MPFESSTPLVFAAVVVAGISAYAWLQTRARSWLALGILAASAAIGLFLLDRLVETDREYIEALFPRLAAAAELQDVDTIIAAIDPDLRPLRADAERAIKEIRPTTVLITRLDVSLDSPGAATADLIVRVSGSPGTTLTALRVTLQKKAGEWLVTDAEVERPGLRK